MGNLGHTLSHTGSGLTFAISLDFPLDTDKAVVMSPAEVHLCGQRCTDGVLIRNAIVVLLNSMYLASAGFS